MKKKRQNAILEIIAATEVETQNQLIEELEKVGIESTQATVSRDIKDLLLMKELTVQGRHRYVPSGRPVFQNHANRMKSIFKDSVISVAKAQNIVVVKTLPGLAPAACSAIDAMGAKSIVGTIAGDDTGFVAMVDVHSAERFCKEIEQMMK